MRKFGFSVAAVLLGGSFAYADVSVGSAVVSLLGNGNIGLDVKQIALYKVFVGDAAHNAVVGTNVLTGTPNWLMAPREAFIEAELTTKQNQVAGSPENFGEFMLSNGLTSTTDSSLGNPVVSQLVDTGVSFNAAAAGGNILWLEYKTAGNNSVFVTVPEPTSMALLGLVGAGLLARRRSAAQR